MSDREALAAALEYYEDGRADPNEPYNELVTVLLAARERLAQLPEKCGTCHGVGRVPTIDQYDDRCLACHGGKVYPAELVERIGESMRSVLAQVVDVSLEPSQFVSALDELAVAVLAALDGETP